MCVSPQPLPYAGALRLTSRISFWDVLGARLQASITNALCSTQMRHIDIAWHVKRRDVWRGRIICGGIATNASRECPVSGVLMVILGHGMRY
jgi:hypothetical protein